MVGCVIQTLIGTNFKKEEREVTPRILNFRDVTDLSPYFPPKQGRWDTNLKASLSWELVNIEAPRQEEYIRYELVFFKSLQNPMRVFSY